MRIPREPDREGSQEGDALPAYDRVSRGIMFKIERNIMMRELKKFPIPGSLMDIGCGPGYLAAYISRGYTGLRVIGLDISPEMLRIAQNNWPPDSYSNIEYITGDVEQLPVMDNAVDCVVSSVSLHHWLDAPKAFGEINRILKPGGRFIIFDLRRDSSRLFYFGLALGQLLSPRPIRVTNGAVGSFWASFTPAESRMIVSKLPLRVIHIKREFGWMIITGSK